MSKGYRNCRLPGPRSASGPAAVREKRVLLPCAAVVLLVLAGGCKRASPPEAGTGPVPVVLHQAGADSQAQVQRASGTVRLRQETPLAFLADGRLLSVAVRPGEAVKAGQLLATLDQTAIDAAAAAADARASQASAELRRQERLFDAGWVAKARVETASAVAQAARSDLSAARFRQKFSRIVAPVSGVILSRLGEPGQMVAAGSPVLVLGEFSSGFVLRAPMPAAMVSRLRPGAVASVQFRMARRRPCRRG